MPKATKHSRRQHLRQISGRLEMLRDTAAIRQHESDAELTVVGPHGFDGRAVPLAHDIIHAIATRNASITAVTSSQSFIA